MDAELVDASVDASPTPTDLASGPIVALSSLSADDRMTWRKTGKFPGGADPATADPAWTPADSSPATVVQDPPADTSATPKAASEPADPYKKATEHRFQEILQSNLALQKELRSLRARADVSVESSTTSATDQEPDPAEYHDLTKYFKDLSAWTARDALRTDAASKAESVSKQTRADQIQDLNASWNSRVTAAKTAHVDFDPALAHSLIPLGSPLDRFVHDVAPSAAGDVLYYLQQHPTEVHRILSLGGYQQQRALVQLEDQATAKPVVKTTTSAPAPGDYLGTRATGSDPVVAARKANNPRAYIDAVNRREMDARKHKGH